MNDTAKELADAEAAMSAEADEIRGELRRLVAQADGPSIKSLRLLAEIAPELFVVAWSARSCSKLPARSYLDDMLEDDVKALDLRILKATSELE